MSSVYINFSGPQYHQIAAFPSSNQDEEESVHSHKSESRSLEQSAIVSIENDPSYTGCWHFLGLANLCTKHVVALLALIVAVNILAPICIVFSPAIIIGNAMMNRGYEGIGERMGDFVKNVFIWLGQTSWAWPTNDV
ncbi:MAG: hypothetical protein FJZ56_04835 [Chlamydiae bacterium]|nr:hypothetical protein [Chlamydiota bacterium]